MKNKRVIILLLIFLAVIAWLVFFWIPYRNNIVKINENFKGVVLSKYYKKGNTIDVKLFSGEVYTPHIGLKDDAFNKISIGDTVEMRHGEFVNLK